MTKQQRQNIAMELLKSYFYISLQNYERYQGIVEMMRKFIDPLSVTLDNRASNERKYGRQIGKKILLKYRDILKIQIEAKDHLEQILYNEIIAD